MTFLDWCLKGSDDDRDLHIVTEDGREYLPGVPVEIKELSSLKPMKIVGKPVLKDNIWYVKLK